MQVNLPAFGATIPGQGGRLAAIVRGADNQPVALLVTGHEISTEWGEYGKDVAGAKSRTDGHANTAAMLVAGCDAAKAVSELEAEGHRDLFIPALHQLHAAAANVPDAFDAKGIYWTSTQLSRPSAFAQAFEYGLSHWLGKGGEFRVRAFRQIPLELLNA